jgi:hypothetical protein
LTRRRSDLFKTIAAGNFALRKTLELSEDAAENSAKAPAAPPAAVSGLASQIAAAMATRRTALNDSTRASRVEDDASDGEW